MPKSIGEALKKLRIQAGLTQEEMCDDVISVSAYSKIERGVHSIDMDTLISILSRNSVMLIVEEFFRELLVNNSKSGGDTELAIDLNIAFLANDFDALNKLKFKIEALPDNKDLLESWNLIRVSLNKASLLPNNNIKKKIKKFRKVENQNIISLTQLKLLLPYLSVEEGMKYLEDTWKKVNRQYTAISDVPFIFLEAYTKVVVIYLELLLKRHIDKELFKRPLDIINTIVQSADYQPITSLGIKAKKIESIINRDKKLYQKIIKVEKIIGLSDENYSEEVGNHPYYSEQ